MMSTKALLKTYIKQGSEYKKMFEQLNVNGQHSAKISKINEKLQKAKKALKTT